MRQRQDAAQLIALDRLEKVGVVAEHLADEALPAGAMEEGRVGARGHEGLPARHLRRISAIEPKHLHA